MTFRTPLASDRTSVGRPPLVPLASVGIIVGAVLACLRLYDHIGVGEYGTLVLLDFALLTAGGGLTGLAAGLLLGALHVSLGWLRFLSNSRWLRVGLLTVPILVGIYLLVLRQAAPIKLSPHVNAATAATPRKPDIVVIILDAVRADALFDADGRIPEWAPNLRALAAEGVVFEDAGAPSPWTLPSHASLLTGLSVLDHGASEEYPKLRASVTTLAEQLHGHGYRTVALVSNPWLGILRGFSQGFEQYFELWRLRRGRLPFVYTLTHPFEERNLFQTDDPRHDKGARLVSRLSERLFREAPPAEPLFVFMNLIEAHPPFAPPVPWDTRFLPADALARGVDPKSISQSWTSILTGEVTLSTDEQNVLKALYHAEIAYMDAHLGRIIRAMKRAGRWDNSLFIVTSDHGCGIGGGRRIGAGFDLGEEMLQIPLIVRFPGGQMAGTRRSDLVYLQDVAPTALQVAGFLAPGPATAAATDTVGGRSLLATGPRTSGVAAFGRPVFMLRQLLDRFPEYDSTPHERRMLATRGPRWKMVWSSTEPKRLFDRKGKADLEDLAGRLPDTLGGEWNRLQRLVGGPPEQAWLNSLARMRTGVGAPMAMDAETMEMLHSLGYVEGEVHW